MKFIVLWRVLLTIAHYKDLSSTVIRINYYYLRFLSSYFLSSYIVCQLGHTKHQTRREHVNLWI